MHDTFAIRHSRLLLAVALSIALGACAKHETRAPVSTTSTAPRPAHVVKAKPAPSKHVAATTAGTMTPGAAPAAGPDLNFVNEPTGIAECDDYLGNYSACHAVLGTAFTDPYTQLAKMRASILDTARDKGVDAARSKCVALVQQRDVELHGRRCK